MGYLVEEHRVWGIWEIANKMLELHYPTEAVQEETVNPFTFLFCVDVAAV